MRQRRRTWTALAVAVSCGSCGPRAHLPGQEAFEAASGTIAVYDGQQVAFGNTPEAEKLAATFGRTLEGMRHLLFTEGRKARLSLSQGHFLTYCQLSADRVCFLVHVPELKNFTAEARAHLLDVAWICARTAASDLRQSKDCTLGVGLRGAVLYGGVATGPDNGTAVKDSDSVADVARLYPFFTASAGPVEATAAEAPTPEAPSRPRATITEVTPRRVKGPWAQAEWRRPQASCKDLASSPAAPAREWSSGRRWQESCGDLEPSPEITVRGTGFSLPPSQNAVFLGGSRAEVVSGDGTHLVVRLAPGSGVPPGPASLVVRTTPADRDDPRAPDRSVAADPVLVLGPPRQVLVAEGDAQGAPVGTTLRPVVFRIVDARGEGVPGERVWIWVRSGPGGRWPPKPIHSEAVTDVLGFARTTLTLPPVPTSLEIQAEAVNATQSGPTPLVAAKATALPSAGDLEALQQDLRQGDSAKRQAAAKALGDLGPAAAAGIPLLEEAARSSEVPVRQAAVDALRTLKPPAALPLYVAALQEDSLHVRMWAAAGLGRMGPAAKDAVPALAAVLRLDRGGRDYGPRVEALAALASIGREAGAAVPALVGTLTDRDSTMRRDAASLLGRIGKPAALPAEAALRKAAREDASPLVRDAARRALEGSFGGVAPTTLSVLDGDGQTRPTRAQTELRARVTDREGRGLPNERVFFEVRAGSAALSPASVLTDADGVARVVLRLGEEAGTVTVEARYEGKAAVFRVHVVR